MIVLDTTVLVYASGDVHRLREPARQLVAAAMSRRVHGVTTVEVVQEYAHVRARRRDREYAVSSAQDLALGLAPLITSDATDLHLGLEIFRSTRLGAFDSVLAAVAMRRGAEGLATADAAFSEVAGLHVLPLDGPELARLIA